MAEKGIIETVEDWFRKTLEDYNKSSDEAKERRDAQKATVYTERQKRKQAKEPTGSAWGIYE